MVRALKSVVKWMLRTLTRTLHPWRRARARRRLEAMEPPGSVLFLCLGNVCRSPYAEASFRRMVPEIRADSAGFIGPDRPAPDQAREVARERGVDLSAHVSKLVTRELTRGQDLVVVMEPRQVGALRRKTGATVPVVVLGDLDPESPGRRTIPDPWGKDANTFDASFDRIDRCLAELRGLSRPSSQR